MQSEPTREIVPGQINSTASEYSYSETNNPRRENILGWMVDDVYDALVEAFADAHGTLWTGSHRLDVDDLTGYQVGNCLAELEEAADCPLDVERWSGKTNTPWLFRVTGGSQ